MKSLHKAIKEKKREKEDQAISKIRYKLNFDLIYGKKEVKNENN